jgi:hypothetical protein
VDIVAADVKKMKVLARRGRVDLFLGVLRQVDKIERLQALRRIIDHIAGADLRGLFPAAFAFAMALLPSRGTTLRGDGKAVNLRLWRGPFAIDRIGSTRSARMQQSGAAPANQFSFSPLP